LTQSVRVRAPASTANIGPGFDCAGAALDLWNELLVSEGGAPDHEHLGVQAFALLADPAGLGFDFTVRIPRERGLGSSASIIALGLVAASAVRGDAADPERLLELGVPLEGHADNLAAALAGGVTLTWDCHIAKLAESLPYVPVAVVPRERVRTAEARSALPERIAHAAAAATVARAAMLGASIAARDADLFAAALHDELHEPYRAVHAPALETVRRDLPEGAVGATLSGSGPTVVVWVRSEQVDACVVELQDRFRESSVLALPVSAEGAGVVG
jgi:homoserine kinase